MRQSIEVEVKRPNNINRSQLDSVIEDILSPYGKAYPNQFFYGEHTKVWEYHGYIVDFMTTSEIAIDALKNGSPIRVHIKESLTEDDLPYAVELSVQKKPEPFPYAPKPLYIDEEWVDDEDYEGDSYTVSQDYLSSDVSRSDIVALLERHQEVINQLIRENRADSDTKILFADTYMMIDKLK